MFWHQAYIRSLNNIDETLTWEGYAEANTARFGTRAYDDPMLELKNLVQTGTLQAYLDEFDLLWNKVGISESLALSMFEGA